MFKICYDIHTWFKQITIQEKTAKKELKLLLLNISLLESFNRNTAHKFKMVWNKKHNLQTRLAQFTDQKKISQKSNYKLKVTLLNISVLKTSNINTAHKFKMIWNKRHNLQTRFELFTDQKNVWKGANSMNWTFHK